MARNDLANGYQVRADRAAELAAELASVSREADEELGEVPDWGRDETVADE